MLIGLFASTRILGAKPGARWLIDLYRMFSVLTVAFTAVHIAAIVADNFVQFGLADVSISMDSQWRPGGVAWGIVAAYLLATVEVSSRIKRRLPDRLRRTLHLASVPLVTFASVHAWQSGSDTRSPLVIGPAVALIVTAVGLLYWRVRHGRVGAATLIAESRGAESDSVRR
ncbi:MAG: sulfoxide reductase heme-binding subunit YedZ [Candidatus Poriferisodalaceae bacterium]